MKQQSFRWTLLRTILPLALALVVLSGCGDSREVTALTAPEPDILVPQPEPATARVEVVVIIATPVAAADESTAQSGVEAPTEEAGMAPAEEAAPAAQGAETPQADNAQTAQLSEQELMSVGEDVYSTNCASCHLINGEGTNAYPALTNSGLLTAGDPTQAILIVLNGRGQMPAFADTLAAEQIAAVLSYERTAWDNNASLVTVAQVQQVQQGGSATEASQGTNQGANQTTDQAAATPAPPDTSASTGEATGEATGQATPTAATATDSQAGGPPAETQSAEIQSAEIQPIVATLEVLVATLEALAAQPATTGEPAVTPQATAIATMTAAATAPEAPAAEEGTAGGDQQLISRGEEVYATNCASCHQLGGEGSSAYPALTNSNLLTAEDPTEAIRIVLQGRGQMPAFEDTLSTEAIAAVLSYERNAWDNNASIVTVAQVRQVRQGGSATEAGQTTTGETEGDTIQAASEGEPTPDNTLTPAGEVTDAASAPAEAMTPTAVMTASQAVTRSADIQQISATQEAIVATLVAITVEPAATATMTATMTAAVTDAPSAEATPSPPATEVEGTPSAPAQNAPIQAAPSDGQALIDQGERLYAINCASCHQLNGQGTNVYPALNNNQELTSEDPTQAIQIVLYGRGQMPAFADILSAEEVAAVLSYERNAWDNNASIVTVEQVNQVQQGDAATAAGQPTEDTGIAPTTDEGAVATATGTATAMLSPTAAMTPTRTAIPSPAGAVELPGAAGGVSPPLTWTPPPVISPTAAVTATAAMTAPTPANGAPTQSLTAEATSVPATPSPPAANNTTPQAAAAGGNQALINMGEEIYASECASCHQVNGEGSSVYPALNNSELLTAEDPTQAIQLVLQGRGQMPGFAETLSTEEIAAVLSYERNSWDNNASPVTVKEVEQVQAADGN